MSETPTTTPTPEVMTPAEVARLFKVDPRTVNRWAKGGRLTSFATLGGHRRYYTSEVRALLAGATTAIAAPDEPAAASATGDWPNGEPATVRAACDEQQQVTR